MDLKNIKEESYRYNFEEYDSPENPTNKEIFSKGFDEGVDYILTELLSVSNEQYPNEDWKFKYLRLMRYILDYEDSITER